MLKIWTAVQFSELPYVDRASRHFNDYVSKQKCIIKNFKSDHLEHVWKIGKDAVLQNYTNRVSKLELILILMAVHFVITFQV